nr:hypothetical protein [uncultured Allomuricauda sp.]
MYDINYHLIIIVILLLVLLVFILILNSITKNINHPLLSLKKFQNDINAEKDTQETISFPADGRWHSIKSDLSGIVLLEIVATANGAKGTGKHSIIFARALNSFGSGKIKITQTYYGWQWWTIMSLRWKKTINGNNLQIRTKSDFGDGSAIQVIIKTFYLSD